MVGIKEEYELFTAMYEVRREWVKTETDIFDNVERMPNQRRVSVDEMDILLLTLSLARNKPLIQHRRESLKELPLHEWKEEIERL